MFLKKRILKNPFQYSDEELADAVRNQVVTIYELSKAGLTLMRKRRIEGLLSASKEQNQEPEQKSIPTPIVNAEQSVDQFNEASFEQVEEALSIVDVVQPYEQDVIVDQQEQDAYSMSTECTEPEPKLNPQTELSVEPSNIFRNDESVTNNDSDMDFSFWTRALNN